MIKVIEFYKSLRHNPPCNLILIFQMENVSPGKQKKKLNISDTIQRIFTKIIVLCTDHLFVVTDDLEI